MAFVADGNANFQAPYPASSGIWTHVAATYDGDFRRFFVNGQMVAMHEQHGPIPASTNNLYIGSYDSVASRLGYAGKLSQKTLSLLREEGDRITGMIFRAGLEIRS